MNWILILVLLFLFFGLLAQTTFGFGNALVSMPLLSLVVTTDIATPLVALVATSMCVCNVIKDWHDIDLRGGKYLLPFALLGIPLGLLWLKEAPEAWVKLLLAWIVLGFAIYRLRATKKPIRLKHDYHAWSFGLIAGILGGAYNTAGPPLVIYGTLREWPKERFRATLQGLFLVLNLGVLFGHWQTGSFTTEVLTYYVEVIPLGIVAFIVGHRIGNSLSGEMAVRCICVMLILIGGGLMLQSLSHILAFA